MLQSSRIEETRYMQLNRAGWMHDNLDIVDILPRQRVIVGGGTTKPTTNPITVPPIIPTGEPIEHQKIVGPIITPPERLISYIITKKPVIDWKVDVDFIDTNTNSKTIYDYNLNQHIQIDNLEKSISYWAKAINEKYENKANQLQFYKHKETNKIFNFYTYSIDNDYLSKFYEDLYTSFTNVRKFTEDSKAIIRSFDEASSTLTINAIKFSGLSDSVVNIFKTKSVGNINLSEINIDLSLKTNKVANTDLTIKTSQNISLDYDGRIHFYDTEVGTITAISTVDKNIFKTIKVQAKNINYIVGEIPVAHTSTLKTRFNLKYQSSVPYKNVIFASNYFSLGQSIVPSTYKTYQNSFILKLKPSGSEKIDFSEGNIVCEVLVKGEYESIYNNCISNFSTTIFERENLKRLVYAKCKRIDDTHIELTIYANQLVNSIEPNAIYIFRLYNVKNNEEIKKLNPFFVFSSQLSLSNFITPRKIKAKFENNVYTNPMLYKYGNSSEFVDVFNSITSGSKIKQIKLKVETGTVLHFKLNENSNKRLISVNIESAIGSINNFVPKIKLSETTENTGHIICLGRGSFNLKYVCYDNINREISTYVDTFEVIDESKSRSEKFIIDNDENKITLNKENIKSISSEEYICEYIFGLSDKQYFPVSFYPQYNGYVTNKDNSYISEYLIKDIRWEYFVKDSNFGIKISFKTSSKNGNCIPLRIYYINQDNSIDYFDMEINISSSSRSMRKAVMMGDKFIDYLGNEYGRNLKQPLYNVDKINKISPFVKVSLSLSKTEFGSLKAEKIVPQEQLKLKTDVYSKINGNILTLSQQKRIASIEKTYQLDIFAREKAIDNYLEAQGFTLAKNDEIFKPKDLSYVKSMLNTKISSIGDSSKILQTPIFSFDTVALDTDNLTPWNVLPIIKLSNPTINYKITESFGKIRNGCIYNVNERNYDLTFDKNSKFDSEFEDTTVEIKISEKDILYISFKFSNSVVCDNGKMKDIYMIDENSVYINGKLDNQPISEKYSKNCHRDKTTGLLIVESLDKQSITLIVGAIGSRKRASITFIINEYNLINDDLIIDNIANVDEIKKLNTNVLGFSQYNPFTKLENQNTRYNNIWITSDLFDNIRHTNANHINKINLIKSSQYTYDEYTSLKHRENIVLLVNYKYVTSSKIKFASHIIKNADKIIIPSQSQSKSATKTNNNDQNSNKGVDVGSVLPGSGLVTPGITPGIVDTSTFNQLIIEILSINEKPNTTFNSSYIINDCTRSPIDIISQNLTLRWSINDLSNISYAYLTDVYDKLLNNTSYLNIAKNYDYNLCFDASQIFGKNELRIETSTEKNNKYYGETVVINGNEVVPVSNVYFNIHIICKDKLILIHKNIPLSSSFNFNYNKYYAKYGFISGLVISDFNNNILYSFKINTSFEALTQATTILKRITNTPIFYFDDAQSQLADNGDYDNLLPDFSFYRDKYDNTTQLTTYSDKIGFLSSFINNVVDEGNIDKYYLSITDNKFVSLNCSYGYDVVLNNKFLLDKNTVNIKSIENTDVTITTKYDDDFSNQASYVSAYLSDFRTKINTLNNKIYFTSIGAEQKAINDELFASRAVGKIFTSEIIHKIKTQDKVCYPESLDLISYYMYYINLMYLKYLGWNNVTDSEDIIYYLILLDKLNLDPQKSFKTFVENLKNFDINKIMIFNENNEFKIQYDYIEFFNKYYDKIIKHWNERIAVYELLEDVLEAYDESLDIANQIDAYIDRLGTISNDKKEKIYYILTEKSLNLSNESSWTITTINNRIWDAEVFNYVWKNVFNIMFNDIIDISLINDAILRDIYNYGFYPIINVPETNDNGEYIPYKMDDNSVKIVKSDYWNISNTPIYDYVLQNKKTIIGIQRVYDISTRVDWKFTNKNEYVDDIKTLGICWGNFECSTNKNNPTVLKFGNSIYNINKKGEIKRAVNGKKQILYYKDELKSGKTTYYRVLNSGISTVKKMTNEDISNYWIDSDRANLVKMTKRNIREAIMLQKVLCKLFISELNKTMNMLDVIQKYTKMNNVIENLKQSADNNDIKPGDCYSFTDFNINDFKFTYNCIYSNDKTLFGQYTYSYEYYSLNDHKLINTYGVGEVSIDIPKFSKRTNFISQIDIHNDLITLNINVPQNNINSFKSKLVFSDYDSYCITNSAEIYFGSYLSNNKYAYIIVNPNDTNIEPFGIYPWNINKFTTYNVSNDGNTYITYNALPAPWSNGNTDISGLKNFRNFDNLTRYIDIDPDGWRNSMLAMTKKYNGEISDVTAISLAYNYYPVEWLNGETLTYCKFTYRLTYTIINNKYVSNASYNFGPTCELYQASITDKDIFPILNIDHKVEKSNNRITNSNILNRINYSQIKDIHTITYEYCYLISNMPTYTMAYTYNVNNYSVMKIYYNKDNHNATYSYIDGIDNLPGDNNIVVFSNKDIEYKISTNDKNNFSFDRKLDKVEFKGLSSKYFSADVILKNNLIDEKTNVNNETNKDNDCSTTYIVSSFELSGSKKQGTYYIAEIDNSITYKSATYLMSELRNKLRTNNLSSYSVDVYYKNPFVTYTFEPKIHFDSIEKDQNRDLYNKIGFFLGSFSQWQVVQDNVREINNMLEILYKLNHENDDSDYPSPDYFYDGRIDRNIPEAKTFWTSTEIDSTDAWMMFFDEYLLSNTKKIGGAFIRPFISLKDKDIPTEPPIEKID